MDHEKHASGDSTMRNNSDWGCNDVFGTGIEKNNMNFKRSSPFWIR